MAMPRFEWLDRHRRAVTRTFNESVFNYPDSKLRDMKVALAQEDQKWGVRLTGSVKMVVWIPFTMFTLLHVDRQTNTLVIHVNRLQVLGALPATSLIRWKPL